MKNIQVITGCMFAGKTTKLITTLKQIKGNYLLVKPIIDNRDHGDLVTTHSGIEEKAIRVHKLSDIFNQLDNIDVIGIDEAQFFKKSIIQDLSYLKQKKFKIIIAGLEKDYLNKPFGLMQQIINMSDSIIRLKARCNQCGLDATYSHRKNTNQKEQFLIGNENFYEALCKECFGMRL